MELIRIHPLFFCVGIVSAFTGQLLLFAETTLAALLHELAHAWYARSLGYRLPQITLMPYGAVVQGDLTGIGRKDEVLLALVGPLANGLTAAGFVAVWWFFPETYAYTDTVVYVSATLALCNLLPALPLDGGRVFFCLLTARFSAKTARRICRGSGVLCALVCLGFGVWKGNFSLLAFGVLLLAGVASKGADYQKIRFSPTAKKRGMPVKTVVLDSSATVRQALRFLDERSYLIFYVEDRRGNFWLTQEEFYKIFEKSDISARLSEFWSVSLEKSLNLSG